MPVFLSLYRAVVLGQEVFLGITKLRMVPVQQTAAVKLDEDYKAVTGSTPFSKRMKTYAFTDKGIMLGVSLRRSKIWKDKKLN